MNNRVDENDDLRQLLKGETSAGHDRRRTSKALNRARRNVVQRDSLTFVVVKLWATLARLLAPFFAAFGEKQAQAMPRQPGPRTHTNDNDSR